MDCEAERVSYESVVEAYCLLSSYVREDGVVGARYDMDYLKEFVTFLSNLIADPEFFPVSHGIDLPPRNEDGSLKFPPTPEHDGSGLA